MYIQSKGLKMHTIKRLYFDLIQKYCSYFPIVAIIGVRQCGKTTLLKTLGDEWKLFDLEKISDWYSRKQWRKSYTSR